MGKPHESTAWSSLLKEEKSLLGQVYEKQQHQEAPRWQPHTPDSHLVCRKLLCPLHFDHLSNFIIRVINSPIYFSFLRLPQPMTTNEVI